MKETNVTGQEIACVYQTLIKTCNELGMTNDEIQKQLTVYRRVPFQIHCSSWGINARGAREFFYNGKEQVVVSLARPDVSGTIDGDEKRVPLEGLILLSDNRKFRNIIDGWLEDFVPKPKGEYPITEAFQVMVGNFRLPWKQENRFFFPDSPRWDYIKIFLDKRFLLGKYTNTEQWNWFAGSVRRLQEIVSEKGFEMVRDAHGFLRETGKEDLALLIDCGLLRYYDGNFASADIYPEKYPLATHPLDGIRSKL